MSSPRQPNIPGVTDPAAFSIRPGETRIDLPAAHDAGLYFIGRVRTPWTRREDCPKNGRETDAVCTIEVFEPFAAGLQDLRGTSHIWVLTWMDKAPRDLVLQTPRHQGETRGVFALRSPARPNPIGLAAADLLGIDGRMATVRGLDCLDGTPLIDIKPYFASTDAWPDARVGWHAAAGGRSGA